MVLVWCCETAPVGLGRERLATHCSSPVINLASDVSNHDMMLFAHHFATPELTNPIALLPASFPHSFAHSACTHTHTQPTYPGCRWCNSHAGHQQPQRTLRGPHPAVQG